MQTGEAVLDKSFKVKTSDEFTADYLAAKLDADDTVTIAGAGDRAIGVVQFHEGQDGDDLDAGEPVTVRLLGISKAIAAAPITRGALLKAAASGKFTPVTAASDKVIGMALSAAGADGDIFDLLLCPSTYYTA